MNGCLCSRTIWWFDHDKYAVMQSGALSRAEVEEKMMVLVGEDIVNRLKSSNWKERLAAMEDLQSRTRDCKENLDASMLIQVVRLWHVLL